MSQSGVESSQPRSINAIKSMFDQQGVGQTSCPPKPGTAPKPWKAPKPAGAKAQTTQKPTIGVKPSLAVKPIGNSKINNNVEVPKVNEVTLRLKSLKKTGNDVKEEDSFKKHEPESSTPILQDSESALNKRNSQVKIPDVFLKKESPILKTDEKPLLPNKPPLVPRAKPVIKPAGTEPYNNNNAVTEKVQHKEQKGGDKKEINSSFEGHSENEIKPNKTKSPTLPKVTRSYKKQKDPETITDTTVNEEQSSEKISGEFEKGNDYEPVDLPSFSSIGVKAPAKPPKPDHVKVLSKHQELEDEVVKREREEIAKRRLPSLPKELEVELEPDEVYDDVGQDDFNRPISMIPTLDEDEELGESLCPDEIYQDVEGSEDNTGGSAGSISFDNGRAETIPEEEESEEEFEPYDDNQTAEPVIEGEMDEIYEELGDMESYRPDVESELKQDKDEKQQKKLENEMEEERKKEEQERKEKEKEEKDKKKKEKDRMKKFKEEEKEQKRQQKIQKELKARFNLTGTETTINSGTIMAAQKGDKKNLALAANDKVFILRIEGNPQGKWLAKDFHGKVGYVDSNNIDIDTDAIKNRMQSNVDSAYNLSIASSNASNASNTESSCGSGGEEYQNMETENPETDDLYEDTG